MEDSLNWYALSVKSRHEFVADSELRKKGIEVFLPSAKRLRQWKDRRKLVEFPLFPGYLFVRIGPAPETYLNVLKATGAVRFVSLGRGLPEPVAAEEIDSLKLVVDSGGEFDIYPELKEGMRVRIKRGPLKGAEGVLQAKDKTVFVVNIDILGRSLGVKIYDDDAEPCN